MSPFPGSAFSSSPRSSAVASRVRIILRCRSCSVSSEKLLLGDTGEQVLDDDEVSAWLTRQHSTRVRDPREEPVVVWLQRAFTLCNLSAARKLLELWAREGDNAGTPDHVHYLAAVNEYAAAARVQRKIAYGTIDPFQRAGALRSLAALERQAGNLAEAVRVLHLAAAMHREEPPWREYGLARMLVTECFETSVASAGDMTCEAFRLGDELGRVTPRLPLTTLEIAVRAARSVHDLAAEAYYERLRIAEEIRVRDLLHRE